MREFTRSFSSCGMTQLCQNLCRFSVVSLRVLSLQVCSKNAGLTSNPRRDVTKGGVTLRVAVFGSEEDRVTSREFGVKACKCCLCLIPTPNTVGYVSPACSLKK